MLEAIDYSEIRNLLNLYSHIVDVTEIYGRAEDVFKIDAVLEVGALGKYEGIEAFTSSCLCHHPPASSDP
jgi:hypothetical protein